MLVETYVAWNFYTNLLKGVWIFEGARNLERFLQIAQDLGLYSHCTPVSIYLCGMGIWWLKPLALDKGHANSLRPDPAYIEAVARHYDHHCQGLCPSLLLIMQHSYDASRKWIWLLWRRYVYLRSTWKLMEDRGLIAHSYSGGLMEGHLKAEPWSKTIPLDRETSVLKLLRAKFSQMGKGILDEHGKKWPSCVWNLGWLVQPSWKELIITVIQALAEAFERYWTRLYQPLHVP